MKKRLLFICLAVTSVASTAMAESTTIYGYRTFQYSASSIDGPVKFQSDAPGLLTLIDDQTDMGPIYGGTYYNYKWFAQVTVKGTQSSVEGWYTVDMSTGERTLIGKNGSYMLDISVDYSDNDQFYGLANDNKSIYRVNHLTGATEKLGTVSWDDETSLILLTFAIDKNGLFYAVSSDDYLVQIDKTTLKATKIGMLNANASYTSSMAFDHNKGVLYWANAGSQSLYTIDTATGAASLVGSFGSGYDTINSLVIPYIDVEEGAPDRVTNRSFNRDGTTIHLSWEAPNTDAQGNALTESTTYTIYRDGKILTTGLTATEHHDQNVSDGTHAYRIVPCNSHGEGGVDSDDIIVTVGPDAPGAVGNFEAKAGDGVALLSWTEPTTSKNGGDFSSSSITNYVITRISARTSTNITIDAPATSYSDKAPMGTYSYTIAAVNAQGTGNVASAGPVMVKPESWILQTNGEVIIQPGKTYNFYDSGGPSANYQNSESSILVVRPYDTNGYVQVKFHSFATESSYDELSIYNGASTSAPLIGYFSGTSIPTELLDLSAINEQGALTFYFSSDIMSNYSGWEATVEHVERKAHDLNAVSITGSRNPIASEDNIYVIEIQNKGSEMVKSQDYKVYLIAEDGSIVGESAGTDIASMASATIDITYTPVKTAEHTSIRGKIAYEDDEDDTNDITKELPIVVIEPGSLIIRTENHSNTISVAPATFLANASISETIFSSELLPGAEGLYIQSLSFFMDATRGYSNVNVELYIGETNKSDFADKTPIFASELTKVFEGTAPIKSGDTEWSFILDKPFLYTGKNLVILFNKYGDDTDMDGIYFKGEYHTGDPNHTVFDNNYFNESMSKFDPNSFTGSYGNMMPDLQLVLSSSAGVEAVPANNGVSARTLSGEVIVSGAEGQRISVFTADGRVVRCVNRASETERIPLAPGFYILATNGETFKVVVK